MTGKRRRRIGRYRPDGMRSVTQLVVTLALYGALAAAGLAALADGRLATALLIACPLALTVVRLFVLQHDCVHFSFFRSRRRNELTGLLLGPLTLVPHAYWQGMHLRHHASSGDISRRGHGDIFTHTTREYRDLPPHRRLAYRLYRHPAVLLLFGAFWYFLIKMRFESLGESRREKRGIRAVNGLLVGAYLLAHAVGLNLLHLLCFHALVVYVSGTVGLVLFYVQHQFEESYWRDAADWDRLDSALRGSSHLILPPVVERLVCRINLHHVHHFDARIPNYHLRDAHEELVADGVDVPEVRLSALPALFRLKLIDERTNSLVTFGEC